MAADPSNKILPLTDAQLRAVRPASNVWLSASAGSGKTQVLSARVIRLLLSGTRPEEILCLTFTKAAAAEMAERINRKLASWVQMDGDLLFHELAAIGVPGDPDTRVNARKLFAQILDAPGGGLQIMTIHSFCQSLLGSFPEEAGIMPGFEPLDERMQAQLQKEALAAIARDADAHGDGLVVDALDRLSLDLGEEAVWNFLRRCASSVEAMRQLPEGQGLTPFVRRVLGVEFEGMLDDVMAELCDDAVIDVTAIRTISDLNRQWGRDRGLKRADIVDQWLGMTLPERGRAIKALHGCWTNGKGGPLASTSGHTPMDDSYASIALMLHQWTRKLCELHALASYADRLADGLRAGKAFALRYEAIKRMRGLVDFDDLIRKAAELLTTDGMTQWVRYKLDQRIDHILVDEAQDTNDRQWAIVEALSEDFFAGEGAKGERSRTIFAVGDFKQAIYGFQGTDPERYRDAGERFADRLAGFEEPLQRLTLAESFRSTQPVLRLVNALVETLGHSRFGLDEEIARHVSRRPDIGSVELIDPITVTASAENDDDSDEEQWLGPEKRALAEMLARRIKALLQEKAVLAKTGRPVTPGDIMVLFRKRTEVASLLVARLHALDVPVAGIDRMRIDEQLAVQDLIAAIRFALQPRDNLSLACLLVSPLIGWSQDKLLEHGYRPAGIPLWQHLRNQAGIADDLDPLHAMLASADFTTPYEFLENILSGPVQGRRKLVARLGEQALVPIEELLNLALEFEQSRGGTLQQFLHWYESNSSEIKRERLTGSDEVQIMTVHGSKGLQAPVVILADMTVDPGSRGRKDPDSSLPLDDNSALPLLYVNSDVRSGRLEELEEERERRELNEHFRLLYVAITRAEERLIMAGCLNANQKEATADSWHAAVERAMDSLGVPAMLDSEGRTCRRLAGSDACPVGKDTKSPAAVPLPPSTPAWFLNPAPQEAKPPRPLAPSQLDDGDPGERPAAATLRHAAERGRLIHGLVERFNGQYLDSFDGLARRWLQQHDRQGLHDHAQIIRQVRDLVTDSRWQPLFGPDARAEVPIAAVVGETVITGRIDRLWIDTDRIMIVDFKTSRRVPPSVAEVSLPELRQMAHYVAAVEKIFPERLITASLLYTHAPAMITLPRAVLAPHRPV